MTPESPIEESLAAFKDSFAYGSRTDLAFKFLKHLSTDEAARFLQDALRLLGEACDDGGWERLIDHLEAGQRRAYGERAETARWPWTYGAGPFARPGRPVAAARLVLLTSSGHFVEGDDPRPLGVPAMTQDEATRRIGEFIKAEPVLSAIPVDTPRERLRVRHGGYDIRGAQADPGVAFPLDRLRELQQEGVIGELVPDAYSFVGACAQTPLLGRTGAAWVETLQRQRAEAALLVPV